MIGNGSDADRSATPRSSSVWPAANRCAATACPPPSAVTADRGYGGASVERDLHALGVRSVAISRMSKPSASRRESNSVPPFATRSNGGPYPKDESTTSNVVPVCRFADTKIVAVALFPSRCTDSRFS